MNTILESRQYAIITGISYLIIFFSAIFANFFVLESILQDPLNTVQHDRTLVSAGIIAFLITVVFDVVVAWSLFQLYKGNPLSGLSALFRMMHATIMAVAIFSLPAVLALDSSSAILDRVNDFNTIWLIGLFFFGMHLITLAAIVGKPRFIVFFLIVSGFMYMVDTVAHFTIADYENYADVFLMLVAVPSIFGEMSLAIWLLFNGGKEATVAPTFQERIRAS
ncbi:MAG: DUF4386 domain-containing protein [Gammaproteobacteria bacterium]|nr:DUF4386 domain-containing protein [Gammaproteobacteria bacterium]